MKASSAGRRAGGDRLGRRPVAGQAHVGLVVAAGRRPSSGRGRPRGASGDRRGPPARWRRTTSAQRVGLRGHPLPGGLAHGGQPLVGEELHAVHRGTRRWRRGPRPADEHPHPPAGDRLERDVVVRPGVGRRRARRVGGVHPFRRPRLVPGRCSPARTASCWPCSTTTSRSAATPSRCAPPGCGPTTSARHRSTTGPSGSRPSPSAWTTPSSCTAASTATRVALGFDLEWETDGPVLDLPQPAGVHGYELGCRVHGEVLVGPRRHRLRGRRAPGPARLGAARLGGRRRLAPARRGRGPDPLVGRPPRGRDGAPGSSTPAGRPAPRGAGRRGG